MAAIYPNLMKELQFTSLDILAKPKRINTKKAHHKLFKTKVTEKILKVDREKYTLHPKEQ